MALHAPFTLRHTDTERNIAVSTRLLLPEPPSCLLHPFLVALATRERDRQRRERQ